MASLNLGESAVDFNLPATDGKSYSLDDFSDKDALLIIFSCVHCPYVKAWDQRMVDIGRDYGSRGLGTLLICSNDPVRYPQDNFASMGRHAADQGYPFPFLHDESQEVASAYGAERTPEVFLFDDERKLVYHGAIDDNYEDPAAVGTSYLRDALDQVLAGGKAVTGRTPPAGCTIKWK